MGSPTLISTTVKHEIGGGWSVLIHTTAGRDYVSWPALHRSPTRFQVQCAVAETLKRQAARAAASEVANG